MFGNLFKQRSHYVFDYKPRYYNERKEKFKTLENDHNDSEKPQITFTKNNLKSQWARNKRQAAGRNVNIRIAIIITIIVGLLMYFFKIHTFF